MILLLIFTNIIYDQIYRFAKLKLDHRTNPA